MQVEVHDINAQVTWAGNAENGVEVRAIVIDEAARLMDDVDHPLDVLIPESKRVGIGDHQSGGVRADQLAHGVDVSVSSIIGRDGHDIESRHASSGRVRAMGGVRNQHLGAPGIATLVMPRPDHETAGELAMGSRGGLQRDGVEA